MGCLTILALGVVGAVLKSCVDAAQTAGPGPLVALLVVVGAVTGGGFALRARWRAKAELEEAETARRFAEQQAAAAQWRFDQLAARFGPEAAANIVARRVWQGATAEMVVEMFGGPIAVDEKVLKTKTSHVYKYNPIAANRYAFKVFLENGVVVGWEGAS